MKKIIFAALLVIALAASLAAIDMGQFPKGSWVDENYDAVWTFSVDNIVLSMTDGTEVFDFKDKIDDFRVMPGTKGIELTFSCDEAGRSYRFVKGMDMSTSITMFIERDSGVKYEVLMPMK